MENSSTKVLYLLDAASKIEQRALISWITEQSAHSTYKFSLIPASRNRIRRKTSPRLEAALTLPRNVELIPLRIAWLPPERNGVRRASFYDLLTFTDPREPGPLRRWYIKHFRPERCKVVVAASATISQMHERWQNATQGNLEVSGFADFVVRQAHFALERAERTMRGARYKVPRFVHEEILARPEFHQGIMLISAKNAATERSTRKIAVRYLREIAATHSPFVIDLMQRLIGLIYRLGYRSIFYSSETLKTIYASAQRYPVIFLPTHKSNLDHLLLQYLLHDHDFPPNHAAGGINMNFFPIGMILRRGGVFFIRRTFKDNEIYKFVLRQYIDYLIEKRFPLEWYIEGGRSRTGKLLPPRFGLLNYVVDAFRRGKSEDVILVPVSIAYDQISDIGSYVAEQRGANKEAESFGWMMRFLRSMRRRYGSIHIRFGETISLAKMIGRDTSIDERNLVVQKLAFEVAFRVNQVTPITSTALVSLIFLGETDRAMTLTELEMSLTEIASYLRLRSIPTTEDEALESRSSLQKALNSMIETGILVKYSQGREPLYGIASGQHLAAAYYRNTVVHFFVPSAISELSLLAARDSTIDACKTFWDEANKIRDLLKFEFFFAEKDAFREDLRHQLSLYVPNWEALLSLDSSQSLVILRSISPFMAHRALRPFLEAYMVVADALVLLNGDTYDEALFLTNALALGQQYLLQRRLHRAESVSKSLFVSALNLAKNRGLVESGLDTKDRRLKFADEIHSILRRIDAIDALQATRRAGFL